MGLSSVVVNKNRFFFSVEICVTVNLRLPVDLESAEAGLRYWHTQIIKRLPPPPKFALRIWAEGGGSSFSTKGL